MDLILTESQFIKLLKEEKQEELHQVFNNSRKFTKNLIKDVKNQYGIDFKFALTWGSVIGGFVGPISRYMEGKYTNLSQSEINLICFGIILTFFFDNKEKLKEVLEIIKEKKLVTFFDRALMKAFDLKDAFLNFLSSLNLTFSKVSNMMAYTFLVPVVPLLLELPDLSEEQFSLIATGVGHYMGSLFSSKIVSEVIQKMIERFRS
jgi:hypothetical protein